jgi:hypothetical protein
VLITVEVTAPALLLPASVSVKLVGAYVLVLENELLYGPGGSVGFTASRTSGKHTDPHKNNKARISAGLFHSGLNFVIAG